MAGRDIQKDLAFEQTVLSELRRRLGDYHVVDPHHDRHRHFTHAIGQGGFGLVFRGIARQGYRSRPDQPDNTRHVVFKVSQCPTRDECLFNEHQTINDVRTRWIHENNEVKSYFDTESIPSKRVLTWSQWVSMSIPKDPRPLEVLVLEGYPEDLENTINRMIGESTALDINSGGFEKIVRECMSALADLHNVGYVHGDVKLANFAVRTKINHNGGNWWSQLQVVLIDLGLAHKAEDNRVAFENTRPPRYPEAGSAGAMQMGTDTYAPLCAFYENCRQTYFDDLESLGYVLWELVSPRRKLPWSGSRPGAIASMKHAVLTSKKELYGCPKPIADFLRMLYNTKRDFDIVPKHKELRKLLLRWVGEASEGEYDEQQQEEESVSDEQDDESSDGDADDQEGESSDGDADDQEGESSGNGAYGQVDVRDEFDGESGQQFAAPARSSNSPPDLPTLSSPRVFNNLDEEVNDMDEEVNNLARGRLLPSPHNLPLPQFSSPASGRELNNSLYDEVNNLARGRLLPSPHNLPLPQFSSPASGRELNNPFYDEPFRVGQSRQFVPDGDDEKEGGGGKKRQRGVSSRHSGELRSGNSDRRRARIDKVPDESGVVPMELFSVMNDAWFQH